MPLEAHQSESQPLPPTIRPSGAPAPGQTAPARQPSRSLRPTGPLAQPTPARSQIVPQFPPRRLRHPVGRFGFLRSLRWRLAFALVGFLAVAFLLLGVFLFLTIRPYLRSEALARTQTGVVKQFANHKAAFDTEVSIDLGTPSPAFEHTIGTAIGGLTDIQQILMVDPRNGQVVAGTPSSAIGQPAPYFSLVQLERMTTEGSDSVTYQPLTSGLGVILIGFRCDQCTTLSGRAHAAALEVITNFDSVNAVIARLMLYIALGMLALVLIAALLGVPLMRRMLLPLTRMTATAQAIAAGNLNQRVDLPHSGDEIGELSASFDEMIDRIDAAFASQRDALTAEQESEAHMRQFVADASHELRTPLTSLRGFTDVLLRGAKDDPETADHVLRAMQRECERMSRLVHDLLTLARLDAGRQLTFKQFDLINLIGESVDQARILAGERIVTMRTDRGGPLVMLGDQDKIKQVLLILLDNALKYGRQGPDGWVQVQVSRAPDMAQLLVVDNGKGIRAEDLPHIFERFYRADKTRSRSGYTQEHLAAGRQPSSSGGILKAMNAGGSGLGLPIALAIIQAHHGAIWAQSQVGQGTQFTIQLPLNPPTTQ
jgi:two-component system, OmpR family, sensor kinase